MEVLVNAAVSYIAEPEVFPGYSEQDLWERQRAVPEITSDQGPDFESTLIKEWCRLVGSNKMRTTPYHPRGNPVERFNKTLLQMLWTLDDKRKTRSKDFIKPLAHAYNCTHNDSILAI